MKNKSRVFAWSLFDFANSSYAVIIVAFVFAVYFRSVIVGNESIGDFYWGIGINISMIITAILSPICGAITDLTSNKKKYLFFFTMLCVICTALMYFTGAGTILFALILFIISNIGFQTGLALYDAFIPELVEEKYYNKVSGIGYAVGYIGSLVSVVLVFPLKDNPNLLFVVTALVFLIFSLPLFLFVKEEKLNKPPHSEKSLASYGFKKVLNTLKNIKSRPNLKNFLISFFFYIDAVNTIIFFAGIYAAATLEFEITELAIFFIIVQLTAMLGSFLFGAIGDKIGILRSIHINLVFWVLIVLYIFLFINKDSYITLMGSQVHQFFLVGGFAGLFLGSTQSLSRTMMSRLVPYESKAEFFGFYGLMDKTSTLLGPLTFGVVSAISGDQNLAVLSVGMFFIIGMVLLKNVNEN
jgi:MFS transporter, UMF1 family